MNASSESASKLALYSRIFRHLFAGSFILSIATWAVICWVIYSLAVDRHELELNLAVSFADEHLERSLDGPILILEQVADLVLRYGSIENIIKTPRVFENYDGMMASLPQVSSGLVLIDSDGRMHYASGDVVPDGPDFSGRAYFKAHKYEGVDIYIGEAIFSRLINDEVFTISKEIVNEQGLFLGLVGVAVDSHYFIGTFNRSLSDIIGNIALITNRGDLLVNNYGRSSISVHFPKPAPFYEFVPTESTRQYSSSFLTGEQSIVLSRLGDRYDVYSIAAIPYSLIFKEVLPSFAIATAILILALIFIGTTERFVSRGLQREKALDAESRQLSSFREAVLENAGLPIIVCDHAAGIVFFNQAAERLLGYPVADVVGRMSLWAILTLDPRHYDPDSHAAASRSTDVRADDNVPSDLRMLSESRRALEGVYIRKDGSTLPVVLSVSTLHRDEGRPGGYVVIAQDRSGEHSAERALRFSEQRQRAILDNILDGIFTINVSGVVSSMNPAGERIFGYTREEVLGRNISILMDNTHRNKHDDYIRRYMQTGEERIIGRGREVPARRKDGTVFPVELSVSRVEFAGRVMFVGVVRDLSEIKKVERLKAEFVSIVSHELRTPLTAMRGSLNMVNSEMLGPLDPDVKELTEIAEQSTDRLIRLINDILDVEKIGAGKLQLHCDLVSIEESLKRAHKDIEPYAAQYDVAVIVDMASDATVWADFDRLQQIILNLASNAVKFSPRGGTVRMASWVETPGWIRVSVEDKGPGIALEFQDRIFEKFAQADSSDRRAKGGTGLGLNITKALTEQMGGHIGFESVPGEGATFYVDFPLREERRGPTTIHAFHLEDNEAIRLIVAHMLSERARITSAGSLEEGLRLAEQHTYDVAILDLGLHDGNGLELVSVLHDGQGGTPPLIILTGQDDLPPDMPPTAAVLTKGRESERAIVERIRDVIDRLFPEAATLSKDTAHES